CRRQPTTDNPRSRPWVEAYPTPLQQKDEHTTSYHCPTAFLRPAGAREKDGEARTTQGLRASRLPPA
ncbi:MAG: hypothetical protein IJ835_00325, partial [Muribaculaceae bacterium]|nr:hypothetical protein [Muribaculaceae bacterium]